MLTSKKPWAALRSTVRSKLTAVSALASQTKLRDNGVGFTHSLVGIGPLASSRPASTSVIVLGFASASQGPR